MTEDERRERIRAMRALYPYLTDEECEKAADALDRYLELAGEIWEETQRQT